MSAIKGIMSVEDAENTVLINGNTKINALMYDDHIKHIQVHLSILDDPEHKSNPIIVNRVIEHVNQHLDKMLEAKENDYQRTKDYIRK